MNTLLNFNAVGFIYLFLHGGCFVSQLASEIANPPVVCKMAPEDDHVLIPKTCGFVVLHDKGELRLHTELRLLIN